VELCGEWNGSRSLKSLSEASQHREVGVKRNLLQAPDTERGEAIVMLQPSKLALDSGAHLVAFLS